MGKAEVLRILEKKKEATIKEISSDLNIGPHNIWRSLVSLVKEGLVERIVVGTKEVEKYNLPRSGSRHIVWRLKTIERR